ncbi:MAG: hypothetical protein IV090_16580 [Candidatus Sericytochromatia bacterium]|nr:hypothetical protein [Candidatus Sericytochromatia bacterium]
MQSLPSTGAVTGSGGPPPPQKPIGGPTGSSHASAAPAKAPEKPSASAFQSAKKAQAGPSGDDSGTSPSEVAASAPKAASSVRKGGSAASAVQLDSAPPVSWVGSSSTHSPVDHKSAVADGKAVDENPVSGHITPLILPDNLSFLSGAQQDKLKTVVRGLAVLDNFCQRNIPGARAMAVQDLTTCIGKINANLSVGDSRISCFLGTIGGHTQEAVIAANFERNGETVAEFSHPIPNSEVDVVSKTPEGQTIYNQIKSGRAIPDLSLDRGPEFVTQMDRSITAAIKDGVPFVRLVGPNLSQPMTDHVDALQATLIATDTALRAGGPEPAKPANLSQGLFDALKANIAAGKPLNISLSCLILG